MRRAPLSLAFVTLALAGCGLSLSASQRAASREDDDAKTAETDPAAGGTAPCRVGKKAALAVRGGKETKEGEYPFVGMLFFENVTKTPLPSPTGGDRETRGCSATVICKDVVLTAAHCFGDDPQPDKYTLHLESAPGENPQTAAPTPSIFDTLPAGGAPGGIGAIIGGGAGGGAEPAKGPPRGIAVKILGKGVEIGMKDLALLKLDRDLGVTPATLAFDPLPEPTSGEGPLARIVGYGATETRQGRDVSAGRKKVGTLRFHGWMDTPDNANVDGLGALYPPDGLETPLERSDNACPGDSGGSTLIDGAVHGVVSRILLYKDGKIQGGATCAESNVTFFAAVSRQAAWVRDGAKALCAGGLPEGFERKAAAGSDEESRAPAAESGEEPDGGC